MLGTEPFVVKRNNLSYTIISLDGNVTYCYAKEQRGIQRYAFDIVRGALKLIDGFPECTVSCDALNRETVRMQLTSGPAAGKTFLVSQSEAEALKSKRLTFNDLFFLNPANEIRRRESIEMQISRARAQSKRRSALTHKAPTKTQLADVLTAFFRQEECGRIIQGIKSQYNYKLELKQNYLSGGYAMELSLEQLVQKLQEQVAS